MQPASKGNPPASPTGTPRNPAEVLADLVAAIPVAFDSETPCDADALAVTRSALDCSRAYLARLDAAVFSALAARQAAAAALADILPGGLRWREAAKSYSDAATEAARLARVTDAALADRAAALDALADTLPGSPRWTRTAEALRDAADAEGFDFDAYGSGSLDGYSGRGMFGREVPALTLDDDREAAVVAHAFRKATGVRASVDSLGRGFVVYPSRLVD